MTSDLNKSPKVLTRAGAEKRIDEKINRDLYSNSFFGFRRPAEDVGKPYVIEDLEVGLEEKFIRNIKTGKKIDLGPSEHAAMIALCHFYKKKRLTVEEMSEFLYGEAKYDIARSLVPGFINHLRTKLKRLFGQEVYIPNARRNNDLYELKFRK